MSKIKKRNRDNKSEESSDNSSSGESCSSRHSFDIKKNSKKAKKLRKVKRKQKRKESSTSSSSENSEPESKSSSSSSKKKKHTTQENKLLKRNQQKEDQEHGYRHRSHNRHSHNRKDDKEDAYNNWAAGTERSKWDSPNREITESEHDRRRNYNYKRNDNYRYNERNRDWDRNRDKSNYRRKDSHTRDWRNINRNRYDRDKQMNRNHDRRSPERRDRYTESDNRNRVSQDRRPCNRDDNERYRGGQQNKEKRVCSRSPHRPKKFLRKTEEEIYEWGKQEDNQKQKNTGNDTEFNVDKEKPNFALSGKLTEDTNKVNGVVIKYSEPLEARKPKRRWRLYPFKGEKALPTLYIHRQSCYLIGRDRKVCDLPVDHPSCSKQHAALQYRLVPFEREDGTVGKRVRPYLIDLESANGTFINNKPIEPRKYVELLEKDVIKFGFSSREYVLLHENSKEEIQDDDVQIEEVQVKEEPTD